MILLFILLVTVATGVICKNGFPTNQTSWYSRLSVVISHTEYRLAMCNQYNAVKVSLQWALRVHYKRICNFHSIFELVSTTKEVGGSWPLWAHHICEDSQATMQRGGERERRKRMGNWEKGKCVGLASSQLFHAYQLEQICEWRGCIEHLAQLSLRPIHHLIPTAWETQQEPQI